MCTQKLVDKVPYHQHRAVCQATCLKVLHVANLHTSCYLHNLFTWHASTLLRMQLSKHRLMDDLRNAQKALLESQFKGMQ